MEEVEGGRQELKRDFSLSLCHYSLFFSANLSLKLFSRLLIQIVNSKCDVVNSYEWFVFGFINFKGFQKSGFLTETWILTLSKKSNRIGMNY